MARRIRHRYRARAECERSERKSAKLSNPLGDWIGHREKLVGVLIEKQVIIAEMRPAYVPVKIFGLHVEREHIRENGIHRAAYVFGGGTCEISWRFQRSFASPQKF
jgi:hypothetical protein